MFLPNEQFLPNTAIRNGSRMLPTSKKEFFVASADRDWIERDDSCLPKIKITLPNIVIKGGYGTPAISLQKPLTFAQKTRS